MESKGHLHLQDRPYYRVHNITPWSKKVIPFPSLRHKIQAYQDDKRSKRVLSWNNGCMFQFSAPPMMQNNPGKELLARSESGGQSNLDTPL